MSKDNDLKKAWRDALKAGLVAGSMLTNPIARETMPTLIPQTQPTLPTPLNPDLNSIAFLESSNGKNINHKKVSTNNFYNAFGPVGLKFMSAHDSFLRNGDLKSEYPGLEDRNKFLTKMQTDPNFYNKLANNLWTENVTKFKDSLPKAVYAWRHGRKAAIDADKITVDNDPYVKSYVAHNSMGPSKQAGLATPEPTDNLVKNAATLDEYVLYISIGIEKLDEQVNLHRTRNNVSFLREVENRIVDANTLLASFALRHNGKSINNIGVNDIGRISVNMTAIGDLGSFKEELEGIVDDKVSIGAGKNLSESDKALYVSSLETPGKMVFYTPNVGYKIDKLQMEDLSKAESEKELEQKKFHWKESFASHVNTADPHKNSPWHKTGKNIGSHSGFTRSNKDNMPTVHKPLHPPHTPQSVSGLREPKAILNDLVNLANKPKPKVPLEDIDKLKSKILKLLENFQSKAATLEELKVTSPDVYQTLVKLLSSIASIGRALPKTDQEKADKVLGTEDGKVPGTQPVQKSEEVSIQQAAFLDKESGVIYGVGACHDPSFLPTEFDENVYQEGFLTSDNEFITREEAGGLRSEEVFKSYTGTSMDFIRDLAKGGLPMPSVKRYHRSVFPINFFNPINQKQKVRHLDENGMPGKTGWVKLGSGEALSLDGHPISSQRINGK